ncbi:hypothetical protein [Nonomuraea sp. B5E05]|uniref:hypothetical protein n=1 Tax=Nonomuraea sp. B5E05 TaxID=3153569 RepID=UPI0032613B08
MTRSSVTALLAAGDSPPGCPEGPPGTARRRCRNRCCGCHRPNGPRLPVPVGTTLHLRAWCNGSASRKAYLEAEGRIGAPGGSAAVRVAALRIEVNMEHFAKHGDRSGIAAEHDYEVNP